tara:strand:- start:181 stop:384 length:204 start_codon:yes stop_codon:yes gene_type:complete
MKRKLIKQQEAIERQKIRNKRSPQKQLDILNKKLGKNIGAIKERNRLSNEIQSNKSKNTSKKKSKKK